MVPSELRQTVPFGRCESFLSKITIAPNTMKIESGVPRAMNDPMPHYFGRTDASRGSSVDKIQINGSTRRCENRCVGTSGDGRTGYDRVWSPGCTDIDFGSRHDVSDASILNTGEGGVPSSDTYRNLGFGRDDAKVQGGRGPKNPFPGEVPSRRL